MATHRHSKGGLYTLIAVASDAVTGEALAIYRDESEAVRATPYAVFTRQFTPLPAEPFAPDSVLYDAILLDRLTTQRETEGLSAAEHSRLAELLARSVDYARRLLDVSADRKRLREALESHMTTRYDDGEIECHLCDQLGPPATVHQVGCPLRSPA